MNDPKTGRFVKTHGGAGVHPLWDTWRGMRKRCLCKTNKDYDNYGGRGITICERWSDFGKFVEYMMPKWSKGMTVGRIENDGPYSPENCRWETMKQQQNNRRNNHLFTFNGSTMTAPQWSEKLGIPLSTLKNRIHRNLPDVKIFGTPKRPTNILIPFKGKNQTAMQWSKELGLSPVTIRWRYRNGLCIA